ncbi:IclR family transcriptional regulator [Dactylosporangium fulvum]|uniref:IclR family transcriptional regulator n=1 Tax=Dactylosporangium fulvum TaxID=53359 RepID=A0ABY5WAM4_9ACTN|nr:IclR family transcriptional regulator [Dactylosporangium fulvum]UWP86069.1 IclR family transcriptional regulator [Dactylosporangium fulvum]
MGTESPTLDLLERLAAAPDRMTFDALVRQVGLPPNVLRGRLKQLVDRGWVDARPADGLDRATFAIGVAALRPGSAFLGGDRAVRLAGPVLSRARDQVDESFRLVRLDGTAIVCLAGREATHDLVGPVVGKRMPAHGPASGRAILAHRSRAEVEAILDQGIEAHTVDSVVDRAALFDELAECRARGWAYERGQMVPGVGCIAAAVPSTSGPVTDAISCVVPLARLTDDHAEEVAACVLRASRDLATALQG